MSSSRDVRVSAIFVETKVFQSRYRHMTVSNKKGENADKQRKTICWHYWTITNTHQWHVFAHIVSFIVQSFLNKHQLHLLQVLICHYLSFIAPNIAIWTRYWGVIVRFRYLSRFSRKNLKRLVAAHKADPVQLLLTEVQWTCCSCSHHLARLAF